MHKLALFPLLILTTASMPRATLWAADPPQSLLGMPLVFADDFQSGDLDRWQPTDPKAWQLTRQGDNRVYSIIVRQSDYSPPVRSPFNRALIKDLTLGNFALDVKLQSTLDTGGHRDLCLFFGYQDDAHFYYVHLGGQTDDHANQIFIVNEAPRAKISTKTTTGTPWSDDWHRARVVHDVDSGKIEVYFDDMQTPAMTATDKTFTSGRVGIGSFDDLGNFDAVHVYGEPVKGPSLRYQRQKIFRFRAVYSGAAWALVYLIDIALPCGTMTRRICCGGGDGPDSTNTIGNRPWSSFKACRR